MIQVYLQVLHGSLLTILNVEVELQPQSINRVLHFYNPQKTFFKKHILIDTESPNFQSVKTIAEGGNGSSQELFACCSDPDAFCEIKQIGKSFSVFLKVSSNMSATSRTFCVMLYNQKYLLTPCEIWRISIHSVHRMDHTLVLGQSSALRLTVRGNHINRRVVCYSHTTSDIKVNKFKSTFKITHRYSFI